MAEPGWQQDGQGKAFSQLPAPQGLNTDISMLWPPCVEVGQANRVNVQLWCTSCCAPSPGAKNPASAAKPSLCPLLSYTEDPSLVVVCAQPSAMSEAACTPVRQMDTWVRLLERSMGVVTVAVSRGPSCLQPQSLCAAACLPVLPPVACQEIRELLWYMMCEALPPDQERPAYDPEAFQAPFELLPPKQQHAMRWAWSNHFRPFALDLNYCFNLIPQSDDQALGGAADSRLSDYFAVLAPMITFLRDHQCSVTLAALLSSCIRQGVSIMSPCSTWSGEDCDPGSPQADWDADQGNAWWASIGTQEQPITPPPTPPPSLPGSSCFTTPYTLSPGPASLPISPRRTPCGTVCAPADSPLSRAFDLCSHHVPPLITSAMSADHGGTFTCCITTNSSTPGQPSLQAKLCILLVQLLVLLVLYTTGACGPHALLTTLALLAAALFGPCMTQDDSKPGQDVFGVQQRDASG